MNKRDRLYLKHIRRAIRDLENYTKETDYQEFSQNTLLQDGVIRKLEIIGEASKRLSPELKQASPQIPWKELAGMRDKLIHDYFGVNLAAVWKTTRNDLGPLKEITSRYLK
jgi:uncharacterized protein with HEPN domain